MWRAKVEHNVVREWLRHLSTYVKEVVFVTINECG